MKTLHYSLLIGSLLTETLLNALGKNKFSLSTSIAPVYTHPDFRTDVPYFTSTTPLIFT